jgi:phage protein D
MTRRTRTFENVTISDVLQHIGSDQSLSVDSSISGPSFKILVQANQSDFAFLHELGRSLDFEIWIESNTLFARAPRDHNSGNIQLNFGTNLHTFSVRADLSTQRGHLVVGGWDVSSKAALQAEVGAEVLYPELQGDASGARIVETIYGGRKEVLTGTHPMNSDQARAFAEAEFKQRARQFVVGSGTTTGDYRLKSGSRAVLQGVGAVFNGKYYVTEVLQQFDSKTGWTTVFTGERPGIAALASPDRDPSPPKPKPAPQPKPNPKISKPRKGKR